MWVFRNKGKEEKSKGTAETVTQDQSKMIVLVEKASNGDIDAFGELYTLFNEKIYRYVFYHVKDKMTAEDITEEVFMKAWKAIDSCKGKEPTFQAWLYRIAHNQVIDYLRTRRVFVAIEVADEAKDSTIEQEVEGALEWQELLGIIGCLPEKQRQVVILKFIEDLDNSEIAQVVGKSEGAVRILQMRALATLRQQLGGERQVYEN